MAVLLHSEAYILCTSALIVDSSLTASDSGTPVLLTMPCIQHAFYPGDNYLEIDFDVHQYTYLARRAITTYMSRLKPVVFETAFIVQVSLPGSCA